jgi:RNA polymerase sigma-70 factor (ECF subfamily)
MTEPSDPAAVRFTMLWAQAHPVVAGFVGGMVSDKSAVDDILQEVALALFSSFASYDPARPFVAWALGVARHKVHDRFRANARSRQVIHDPELLEALAEVSEQMGDELEERRAALQECLRQVEGRPWDLLQLHYVQDLEPASIAERLGLKAGHVRVLLHRVRGSLRQCIERRLGAGGAR